MQHSGVKPLFFALFCASIIISNGLSQLQGSFRRTTSLNSRRAQPGQHDGLDTSVQDAVRNAILEELRNEGLITNSNLLYAMAEIDKVWMYCIAKYDCRNC